MIVAVATSQRFLLPAPPGSELNSGNFSRNINVEVESGQAQLNLTNKIGTLRFVISDSGRRGIYDVDNEKWLFCEESSGEMTANTAVKLGTSDVGDSMNPIYLSRGVPTACKNSIPVYGTKVVTFTDGTATLTPSDFGLTEKPTAIVMTPQSNSYLILRYDWDNSSDDEVVLTAYTFVNGSPAALSSNARFCYVAL